MQKKHSGIPSPWVWYCALGSAVSITVSRLTSRAVKRAALLMLKFFDGVCAAITGFIVSSIDVELLGKVAGLPVSALKIF